MCSCARMSVRNARSRPSIRMETDNETCPRRKHRWARTIEARVDAALQCLVRALNSALATLRPLRQASSTSPVVQRGDVCQISMCAHACRIASKALLGQNVARSSASVSTSLLVCLPRLLFSHLQRAQLLPHVFEILVPLAQCLVSLIDT